MNALLDRSASPRRNPTRRSTALSLERLEGRELMTIFGLYPRQYVNNTTAYPFRAVTRLEATFPDGKVFSGTGAFIDPNHVLTAGHMVYSKSDGGWATRIKVTPGQQGNYSPYGYTWMSNERTYNAWTNSGDRNYDMAVITTSTSLGSTVGWFGYQVQPTSFFSGGSLNSAGYPADKSYNGVNMYSEYGPTSYATDTLVYHKVDQYSGQSGSPMWFYDTKTGSRYIDAIEVAEIVGGMNISVRINSSKFNDIKSWLALRSSVNTASALTPVNDPTSTAHFAGSPAPSFSITTASVQTPSPLVFGMADAHALTDAGTPAAPAPVVPTVTDLAFLPQGPLDAFRHRRPALA
jgi:V8-like Glu-specific endopeptidase